MAQSYNVRRLRLDLSDKCTLTQLHRHCRLVLRFSKVNVKITLEKDMKAQRGEGIEV
jgi:hypothetical protein